MNNKLINFKKICTNTPIDDTDDFLIIPKIEINAVKIHPIKTKIRP